MSLMSAGMATMYLNERLSFGMAPDDIAGVFTQRLRWCVLVGGFPAAGGQRAQLVQQICSACDGACALCEAALRGGRSRGSGAWRLCCTGPCTRRS